jgi:hypothetical protein
MAGSASMPRKRGRPVGAKDSYQRVRRGVGEPTTAPRLPRVSPLRLVPPPAPEPMTVDAPGVMEITEAPPASAPGHRIGTQTALAHALRDRIWAYCTEIGYDPWQAMIAMALSAETPSELKFMCHREIASYLLAKLKAVDLTGQVEHHHTSQALQVLFAALEQQEDAERARLPGWRLPALETLGRHQQERGEWDRDEA